MEILQQINQTLQEGDASETESLVKQALEQGIKPEEILSDGLLAGMNELGVKFKNNEVFVPEVLVAARAMKKGVEVLKDKLGEGAEKQDAGVAIIGTVKGDMHDIGKNLVKIMLEGKGIKVYDLGVDVPGEKFVEEAQEKNADILCISALLTTTMPEMEKIVAYAKEKGLRSKIMVGGAPVTQEFCDRIGADCYTEDAASAADAAVRLIQEIRG